MHITTSYQATDKVKPPYKVMLEVPYAFSDSPCVGLSPHCPEAKIGLPWANTRGILNSPS